MAERGVGISVQAIVGNLGIDPSTVTCTLRYSNQLRYAHAQFGLRFEMQDVMKSLYIYMPDFRSVVVRFSSDGCTCALG